MTLRTKALAFALSAVLACGMAPSVAFADSLSGAHPASAESAAVTTQASAKSMKVITGIRVVNSAGVTVEAYDMDYNANGLIKKRTFPRGDMTDVYTYGYNKRGDVVKLKQKGTKKRSSTIKVKRNKAGVATKETRTTKSGGGKSDVYKIAYTLKNGRVASYVSRYYTGKGASLKKQAANPHEGEITYKNGRVVKHKVSQLVKAATTKLAGKTRSITYRYAYDGKGNMKKIVMGEGKSKIKVGFKNTYKKGLLVKRATTRSFNKSYKTTTVYTYETVKVPAKMAKKVKAQQWALLNNNENFVIDSDTQGFGLYGLPGAIASVPWE